MRERARPTADVKDMMIAGCPVRLSYERTTDERWIVNARVKCGVGDYAEEESVGTKAFDSREAAERDALQQVTELL